MWSAYSCNLDDLRPLVRYQPQLSLFRGRLRVLLHLTRENLRQYNLIICSVYEKKYSGTGIPCTFCATRDGIRYSSLVKKSIILVDLGDFGQYNRPQFGIIRRRVLLLRFPRTPKQGGSRARCAREKNPPALHSYSLILRLQTLPKLVVGSTFMQSRLTALIFRAEHRQIFIQRSMLLGKRFLSYEKFSTAVPSTKFSTAVLNLSPLCA